MFLCYVSYVCRDGAQHESWEGERLGFVETPMCHIGGFGAVNAIHTETYGLESVNVTIYGVKMFIAWSVKSLKAVSNVLFTI